MVPQQQSSSADIELNRVATRNFVGFLARYEKLSTENDPRIARDYCAEQESWIFSGAKLPANFPILYCHMRAMTELLCQEIDQAEKFTLRGLKLIATQPKLSERTLHAELLLMYANLNLIGDRKADAPPLLSRALKIAEEAPDRSDKTLARISFRIANVAMTQDEFSTAAQAFKQAFEYYAHSELPENELYLGHLFKFIALTNFLQMRKELLPLVEHACELQSRLESLSPIDAATINVLACELFIETGAYERAREHAHEALDIHNKFAKAVLPSGSLIHTYVLLLVSSAALDDRDVAYRYARELKQLTRFDAEEYTRMSMELRDYYESAKANNNAAFCKAVISATKEANLKF